MGKSNWQSANATSIYCGTQFHSRNCNTSDFAMAATNLWFPGIIITNFIIHCIDVAVSSAPFEPTKKLEYINRIVCMCLESTIYLSFVDWRSVAGCRLRVGWICQKNTIRRNDIISMPTKEHTTTMEERTTFSEAKLNFITSKSRQDCTWASHNMAWAQRRYIRVCVHVNAESEERDKFGWVHVGAWQPLHAYDMYLLSSSSSAHSPGNHMIWESSNSILLLSLRVLSYPVPAQRMTRLCLVNWAIYMHIRYTFNTHFSCLYILLL